MLVLTRKPQESITIRTETGEIITVVMLKTNGKNARIGIKASEGTSIMRTEVNKEQK